MLLIADALSVTPCVTITVSGFAVDSGCLQSAAAATLSCFPQSRSAFITGGLADLASLLAIGSGGLWDIFWTVHFTKRLRPEQQTISFLRGIGSKPACGAPASSSCSIWAFPLRSAHHETRE